MTTAELGGAARLGLAIKLVARAERDRDGALRAAVSPMAVRATSSLGSTDGVLNLVEVVGDPVGRVSFRGPGAGGPATSSAVLGDLLAIARGAGLDLGVAAAGRPAPVAVVDDLAGLGGWFFVAPELMIGHLPASIAEVVLVQDMEAFVVRSMALDSLRGPARRHGHRHHHLPRALGGLRHVRMSQVLQRLRAEEATAGPRPRLMQRFAPFLPVTAGHAVAVAGGGRHAPGPCPEPGTRRSAAPTCTSSWRAATRPAPSRTGAWSWPWPRRIEEGARAIICASTGNTSASAAAYGAAAGLEVVVVLPQGKIAAGKLLQAQVAGARVLAIEGGFDEALAVVRELTETPDPDHPVTLVNSVNPHRLQGQKTAAFEVCEDLGGAPDYLAIPVGNAGNISAYWMGFTDYRAAGIVDTVPVMLGFQAAGAAPLVLGHTVSHPETIATAIRIGDPASGDKALRAQGRVGRPHRVRDRRADPRRLPRPGAHGGHLLRAGQRRVRGRRPDARRRRRHRPGRHHRVRAHGPRPQGPGHRRSDWSSRP